MTQGRAARAVANALFTPDDVLYCAMPLYHGNALNANLFPALRSGATIALRRKFSASAFLPDAQRYGVTFFNTVGRALNHILSTPETDDDRNHSIKYVLGPETAPADVRAFRKRFGPPVIEGYGSSENAIILIPDPDAAEGLARAAARRHRRRDPRSGHRGGEAASALRRARKAAQRGRSDRRVGEPQRDGPLRGLLQQSGSRRRADAQRLVLVGRPRLSRRGRRVLVRGSQRRLDPRRRRELRGRARSNGSLPASRAPTVSPSTRCPTAVPAIK